MQLTWWHPLHYNHPPYLSFLSRLIRRFDRSDDSVATRTQTHASLSPPSAASWSQPGQDAQPPYGAPLPPRCMHHRNDKQEHAAMARKLNIPMDAHRHTSTRPGQVFALLNLEAFPQRRLGLGAGLVMAALSVLLPDSLRPAWSMLDTHAVHCHQISAMFCRSSQESSQKLLTGSRQ